LVFYDCDYVYHLLTKQVPTHFNLTGNPNLEKALLVDPITCDAKYPVQFKPDYTLHDLVGDENKTETEKRLI